MRRGKSVLSFGLLSLCAVCVMGILVNATWAAEKKYPTRSIDLTCGYSPGGLNDLLTRYLAKGLEKQLGVPVVPGNTPGGGGLVAASILAKASPDGYTLAQLGDSAVIYAFLRGVANYAKEDLIVVGECAFISNVLAVSAESPWKTIKEFVDYAREKPGLNYAHPGVGAAPSLRVEYFNKVANLKMKGVPFKSDAECIAVVLGQHVAMGVFSYQAAKAQVDSGKMRILFSFDPPGLGPDPTLPNIPSFLGKGVPDIDPVSNYLVAPGKTPDDVINILVTALEKCTKDPEFIDNMKKIYGDVRFTPRKTLYGGGVLEKRAEQVKPILKDAGLMK